MKDSGVEWLGEVPKHWEMKRLRHVVHFNPTPDWNVLERQQSDYPFLPMEAISETGELDTSRSKSLAEARRGYSYFSEGDVTYAKVTPCFENGKGTVMRGLAGGHGFGTTELTVMRPFGIDRQFLYMLTYAHCFRSPAASEMLGTGGLKRVPENFARDYRCALPPLAEQSEICIHLDRATTRIDALVAKKIRFIELLREKRQAVITHAVTKGLDARVPMKNSGVRWIGVTPAHWSVCKINFRFSIQLGKMLDEKKIAGSNLIQYLRNQDVQWDGINTHDLPEMDIYPKEIERYTAISGDLLVCEGGEVGRASIWRGDRIGYQKALHRLRPRHGDSPDFMRYVLMSASASGAFAEGDTKSTISHLPAEKFRMYLFAFPPKEEQQAIATHLDRTTSRIDTLIAKTERSIELLREHRTALITAAVTGKIDLSNAA